jgi:membrane fusion protein (multidrug efflux system)
VKASRIAAVAAVAVVVVAAVVVLVTRAHRHGVEKSQRARREAVLDEGERITATRVETTPIQRTLTLPGDVHGYNEATLYAKVAGYVRDVRVQRGERVKGGEVVAIIESPENKRDVASARDRFDLARVVSERTRTLTAQGLVAPQDRDNAVTQERVSRSALQRATDVLDYTVVRAPFDGIVSARYVDPGALVPAATGATQSALPIVDVADVSMVRVFVYVGQDAAPFVRVGDAAMLWQEELPDRRIPGKVAHMTGALDPRTRSMQVELDIANDQWDLLPGTFAHVEIRIAEPPAPLIPDDAIVVRDGKTQVVVVEDGRAHYVGVDLGYNDGSRVRVLRGLKGGETVGTSVPVQVEEGSPVRVVTPQQSSR